MLPMAVPCGTLEAGLSKGVGCLQRVGNLPGLTPHSMCESSGSAAGCWLPGCIRACPSLILAAAAQPGPDPNAV